jgi:AraC-like DNA-binding protein
MELLSQILSTMKVQGSVYFCDALEKTPWEKLFIDTGTASFHMVRRGECWVEADGVQEYLGSGDFVFLGKGVDHRLTSRKEEQQGGQSISTLLLCGYCDFQPDRSNPLLNIFPSMVIVRHEELIKNPWLNATLEQLGAEYLAQSPGAELAVNKLTEIVLIELIRINFGREEQSPLLIALQDKAVAKALGLIHGDLQKSWTLDALAKEVALSRAAFARRFTSIIGQPMFQYLTGLRMQKAKELLKESNLPVYAIANQLGYESDASFVKTFKKIEGVTPRQFQKAQLA